MARMHDEPVADDPVAGVGGRLRAARTAKRMTLAALAAATGVSVSTLSRLESGQRKVTLELLVPIARTLGVSLDALVAAEPAPNPKVVRPAVVRDGLTILPLSQPSRGIQAFHTTIPDGSTRTPDLRTHEGYEWLYVLRGRLRLLLGATDLVLTPGEAAEFDTTVPHWFGNAGKGPVQYLSLFGPQGQRAHVRARPGESTVAMPAGAKDDRSRRGDRRGPGEKGRER